MSVSLKKILYCVFIALLVLVVGFMVSSRAMPSIKTHFYHHLVTLKSVDTKHCFLFPTGGYSDRLLYIDDRPLSFWTLAVILVNSFFNILFQPVFLCPFTPQVVLNVLLLPFFLYGTLRYLDKAWIILAAFIAFTLQVGIYDSGVESVIRHGMICELLYLMIGLAGFAGWITKSS